MLPRRPRGRTFFNRNTSRQVLLVPLVVFLGLFTLNGAKDGDSLAAAKLLAAVGPALAVPAPAGVYGFVEKAGPTDFHHWHPEYREWRVQQREKWLAERQKSLAVGKPPPPLPNFLGCQVFVNHLYKVIYLRHAKTASRSLLCHFSGCREGDNSTASDSADLSFTLFKAEDLKGVNMEEMWKDYFVVTFIRNPYQRAVSSYRMMMRQLSPDRTGSHAAYGWNDFCADPAGFAQECVQDERCRTKGENFVYAHIEPQQDCIMTADGGWAADFVGRVEKIDEDLSAVLQEIEKRRIPNAPPVKMLDHSLENVNGRGCNETGGAGKAAAQEQYCDTVDYFQGTHAACFDSITRSYQRDVQALKIGLLPGAAAGRKSKQ